MARIGKYYYFAVRNLLSQQIGIPRRYDFVVGAKQDQGRDEDARQLVFKCGGFHGGIIRSEQFRELIVRWFQYAVFCPIFRLHGYRLPFDDFMPKSRADNEVWSFRETAYGILRDLLRSYIHEQMQIASQRGLPPMRPLFVDFPQDPDCETIEDQFMFGPEIMVAPVLCEGARERDLYLPSGAEWINAWDGTVHPGGQRIDAPAPLETIPVFLKKDSRLRNIFHADLDQR